YPGTSKPAVNELNLSIADGELLVLVGPSGSGKSTALRMLAGLEPLDEGKIMIGGKDVSAVRPRDRDIAMVFQSYALYPQLDVAALSRAGESLRRRVHRLARDEHAAGVGERPAAGRGVRHRRRGRSGRQSLDCRLPPGDGGRRQRRRNRGPDPHRRGSRLRGV